MRIRLSADTIFIQRFRFSGSRYRDRNRQPHRSYAPMACNIYLDLLSVDEFTTKLRSGRSKKRDKELKSIRKRGQERRVLVSTYGEVLNSDIPLYEALETNTRRSCPRFLIDLSSLSRF